MRTGAKGHGDVGEGVSADVSIGESAGVSEAVCAEY